ncbi:NUDIX domain-containing protein [Bacillus sp. NSP9.1]|uniref:NUDIX domain-containing protein n=1 Tax=Bacillus sp. NSP9.1 TaxID=1071078 RepID=UPI000478F67C|nr:NUDIX domain-containing protein [Bacillus sp. NSP9.1]QHZ48460.1 NUDIX domain-containing protein [Bacillus sp. NSP9.1]
MKRTDYYHDVDAPRPQHIVPAVSAVVINEEKQILLQKRVDNNKWSLPGGNMEPGESISEAIKREVLEETGLNVEVIKLIGVYSDPNHIIAYQDGEVRQQFSICFFCKPKSGTLIISEESKEVSYINIKELDSLSIHPSQQLRIKDALSFKNEAYIR